MNTETYESMVKAQGIADELLGKSGMAKYPLMLLLGLILVAKSIKKHIKPKF